MNFSDIVKLVFDAPRAQESEVDAEQLKMGIEVEKEHTTHLEAAKAIALAHLKEDPMYYTKLKKMEKGD